jgi:aspartyl-tRNA(Asn)/glutamyl-tRNA(Gln) amidotransferase subunit B
LFVGRALGGKIADYSRFDRKNYFYPDLPKGYQISQYKYPLVQGGNLNNVRITRIHLEEDTGRLIHTKDSSLVDYNRAGVPLMELVTEPYIKSGEEARKFAEEFQLILRYLDASDADMEKGHLRIEANISLRPETTTVPNDNGCRLGTKVEIKNLNSFRAVEKAISYEIERQTEVLNEGEKIKQETRGWDETKQITFSQREKEESHDYRYFPEPDLPALKISNIKYQISNLPELPQQKRERFKEEYKLKDKDIETMIYDKKFADYFEEVVNELQGLSDSPGLSDSRIQLAVNYLTSDLQGLMKVKSVAFDTLLITPENFAELIVMIGRNEISSRTGKDVLKIMLEKGGDPSVIVGEKGLRQKSDETSLIELAEKIIKENPLVINDYKKGKETAMQFLIGQGMKLSKGSVNPELLKNTIKQRIS